MYCIYNTYVVGLPEINYKMHTRDCRYYNIYYTGILYIRNNNSIYIIYYVRI